MNRVAVYPYLRPSSGSVQAAPWRLADDPNVQVSEALPDWDPNMRIRVCRQVRVHLDVVHSECLLKPDDCVALAATWYSGGTSLRGTGTVATLSGDAPNRDVTVELDIDGRQLAGDVYLKTLLVLASASSSQDSPLAPRNPGTVLWSHEQRVLLEGIAARFPVEVTDFRALAWLPPDAAWFLDWDPTAPESPLMGSLRLLVNSSHPAVCEAVASTKITPEQKLIRGAIYHDVGRSLIRGMLCNEAFVGAPQNFAPGTLGYHVASLLKLQFKASTAAELRELRAQMSERPEYFEARLQVAFRLFCE